MPSDAPPIAVVFQFNYAAISPDAKNDVYTGIGDALASIISNKLDSSKKLRIVDRHLINLLLAGPLQQNDETALPLGRILGAKYYIFGTYTIKGDQVAISMWVDSTETGQVLESKSVSDNMQNLVLATQKLAVSFLNEFDQAVAEHTKYPASPIARRTTVAVADFTPSIPAYTQEGSLGKALAGFLAADLAANSRLYVSDRAHTAEILAEQRLATIPLVDPATRVSVGHVLETQYFVLGTYAVTRNQQTTLTAQVASVNAGQILCSKSVSGDSKDLRALSQHLATDLLRFLENESQAG